MSDLNPTTEESIRHFEAQQKRYVREHNGKPCPHYANAIEALRRVQPANDPLTLEQLRGMDGEPVWVKHRANVKFGEPWQVVSEWMIVDAKVEWLLGLKRNVPFGHLNQSEALAYRRKPERSENDA